MKLATKPFKGSSRAVSIDVTVECSKKSLTALKLFLAYESIEKQ